MYEPQPKTRAGQTTKDALINAAIVCLARHGYAATTMRKVSDEAGVTQGPRQYYFPSSIDLFAAVVDEIHSRDAEKAKNAYAEEKAAADQLKDVIQAFFAQCGSDQHIAMIELKLASRGDKELASAIGPKIKAFEERADNQWLARFAETGLSKSELATLRTIITSTLRGLGVAIITSEQTTKREVVGSVLANMVTKRLGL